MVAKVTTPKGISRFLNYNEQKIKTGKAECIYAHQFLKNAQQLHFHEKKNRFENLIALNKRATTNAIHVSDKQPYLEYQHLDVATLTYILFLPTFSRMEQEYEERLLKNSYSINLPTTYQLKNKRKQS